MICQSKAPEKVEIKCKRAFQPVFLPMTTSLFVMLANVSAHKKLNARSLTTPGIPSFFICFVVLSYFKMASANASSCGTSSSRMADLMVTMGSTMLTFFIGSMRARMAFPADGAQLPFSTIPTVRFW